MKKKIKQYFIYVIGTLLIVLTCVNFIFTGLHDSGRIGMLVGLTIAQVILPILVFKTKWHTKLMMIVILNVIPFSATKSITRKLYALEIPEAYISNRVDLIGYVFYFLISIMMIEICLILGPSRIFNKKTNNHGSETE